jgi:protein SCO1/2
LKTKLSRLRLALWALVAVAAAGAGLLFFAPRDTAPVAAAGIGGGQYALVDDRGNAVDQTMLVGQPSLVFFGFTHCPEVCPTTLSEMAVWFEQLGDEARNLRAFFVSIDPERDTPEIMRGYVEWLGGRVTGITGERAEIDKMAKAWRAFYEKVPGDDGEYTMNHTASVFLANASGEFEGTIAYEEDAATAVDKIRKLLGKA